MQGASGHAIAVSHDGKIIDSSALERTRPQLFPAGANLASALGIQCTQTAARLKSAVLGAAQERRASMLRWRDKEGSLGNLLAVYPAREPGIALVSVTELDKPLGEIDPALLVETFDVTRAEAEIAVALYSGLDLSEVALLRGVASATVRGQVKALLHKAGVASQRHLMLVLSRVAAASPPTWGATTRSSVEPGYASRPEGFDPALTASSKKVTLSVRRRAAL